MASPTSVTHRAPRWPGARTPRRQVPSVRTTPRTRRSTRPALRPSSARRPEASEDGQAQQRVGQRRRREVVERHRHERGTEEEPDGQRHEPPSSSGSSATSCASATSSGSPAPNAMPATNAAIKPLPSSARASAKLARAAASVARRRPPAMIHRRLEPEVISQAVEPEHEAHDDAEREIEQRAASRGLAVAGRPHLVGDHREGEDDDRGHDAVVESALHVQRSTQPQRYPLVVDDLHAERRPSGQRRPHETGERPGEVVEDHGSNERTEDHREGQADAQQASREGEVSSQLGHVHPCRVREQQECEGQLGQQVDRRRLDVHGEGPTSDSPAGTRQRRTRGRR